MPRPSPRVHRFHHHVAWHRLSRSVAARATARAVRRDRGSCARV